ncbi:hypothetical protein EDB83DRAFT_1090130 [Lactarius deliciosus]|nr:hypothetical protein EDB83DRAFT_1090130 [Lactarius deliciosus]
MCQMTAWNYGQRPIYSYAPVPSLRAASPVGFDDEQEVLQSRPASFRSPSSDGLTGLTQQSVLASSHSEENLPAVYPQTEIVTDASSLPTPPSPAPSEKSSMQQSSTTEEPQVLFPTSSSQRSASPSPGSGDASTPHYPQLPPSPRSVLSARAASSSTLPVPLDLSASPRIAFPDASPSHLRPSELDTSMASPTSPTVPSLFCSSSSELSHSTVFTDNGETPASPTSYTMPVKGRRANLSPITVKSSDGGFLCDEIIIETTESFPEDDVDPFAASGSQSTAPAVNLKVDVSAVNAPRRRPLAFLGMATKRASTLDPSSAARISKSTSMASLRRSMTTALQARARPRSTLSPVDVPPPSPPLSPLNVTMHNGASILAQASLIDDDETRRLSELAFM